MEPTPAISPLLRGFAACLGLAVATSELAARGHRPESAGKFSLEKVLGDAHHLASAQGDAVVRVQGASMLPYFGDGAVLVVRRAAVESLRPGMIVVYRNRFGEAVAHRIEERSAAGWVVRGANNVREDSTVVNAENLLGTVYVTLYSDPLDAGQGLGGTDALAAKTLVALAAPAR